MSDEWSGDAGMSGRAGARKEWHMASAVRQSTGQGRARTAARESLAKDPASGSVSIVENPISVQNPALGRAVEDEARRILGTHDLGRLEVRFRVCRDEPEGIKFICKVESPAPADLHQDGVQWRWWSPLMETAQDFRAALLEAIEIRRQRLATQSFTA
jgi:hypothetical protein